MTGKFVGVTSCAYAPAKKTFVSRAAPAQGAAIVAVNNRAGRTGNPPETLQVPNFRPLPTMDFRILKARSPLPYRPNQSKRNAQALEELRLISKARSCQPEPARKG